MSNPRIIDYAEAKRLRAEGVRVAEIAARFGVTPNAIYYATDDGYRARNAAFKAAWQRSGVCANCGAACTREGHPSQGAYGVPLCVTCASKRNRTRFRHDAAGAITEIRCSRCRQWKSATSYPADRQRSEGKHGECRACLTEQKRLWRAKTRGRAPGGPCGTAAKYQNGCRCDACREALRIRRRERRITASRPRAGEAA